MTSRTYGAGLLLGPALMVAGLAFLRWSGRLQRESYRAQEEQVSMPLAAPQGLDRPAVDSGRPSRLWAYSLWTASLGDFLLGFGGVVLASSWALGRGILPSGAPAPGLLRQVAGWAVGGTSLAAAVAAALFIGALSKPGFAGGAGVRLVDLPASALAFLVIPPLIAFPGVRAGLWLLGVAVPWGRQVVALQAASLLFWIVWNPSRLW